ncbi:hypothetical protein JKP88DRAFT_307478 [Tribonema minus]|uniref:Uncharacterized protein n=1 Tax=Tribonema minus TaxID=303371 RepID=A0A836CL16_9STRA|nr:hypothetical protein JKP88DRAFT_307478 [Tribonema minus]
MVFLRLELVFGHGLGNALLTWAVATTRSWDVGRRHLSELVGGEGHVFCRTTWGFINRLRGTTGRTCKVLLRAVAEWSEQQRAPCAAVRGLAGRRAARNARPAVSSAGGVGGSSGGGGGASVSSRAWRSESDQDADADVFDEIADAALDVFDSEADSVDAEHNSAEKVGRIIVYGQLGISSGRGGEAHVHSSTIQQMVQQMRGGDELGALVSNQRVEPVQDADRAQLVDVICAQVCHLNEEMRTALRLRLLQQELVCVSLEAVAGGSDKDGGAQAGTWPGVWVDLLMLLRALYVEQCALNGIFWDRAADGSAEQTAGAAFCHPPFKRRDFDITEVQTDSDDD